MKSHLGIMGEVRPTQRPARAPG